MNNYIGDCEGCPEICASGAQCEDCNIQFCLHVAAWCTCCAANMCQNHTYYVKWLGEGELCSGCYNQITQKITNRIFLSFKT